MQDEITALVSALPLDTGGLRVTGRDRELQGTGVIVATVWHSTFDHMGHDRQMHAHRRL